MLPGRSTASISDLLLARSRWTGPLVAVVSSTAAFMMMSLLHVERFKTPLYPFFTIALILSSLTGGAKSGFLAFGLSLFYIARFILPVHYLLTTRTRESWLPLCAYGLVGVFIPLLVEALQKRQRALQDSRQRLQGIFDNAGIGIVEVDSDDRFVVVNSRFCEIVGYSSEELLRTSVPTLTAPEDRERTDILYKRMREGLHERIEYEKRYLRRDGSVVPAYVTVSAIRDTRGRFLRAIATVEDMTERKRSQEALIRSEKLASVGRMAATIAHEVNNPLAGATNAVYIAMMEQGLTPQGLAALKLADQELRRAALITAQTLAFVRETGARTPIVLPELIDEVVSVYSRKLRERGISVERRYKCGICCEKCDSCFVANSGELRQAISNLVGNGIDALRDKGTLHVRLCRMAEMEGKPTRLRLTIADNGCGIRTENLKRIFEPFFTTKESVGTGLGLWISQQVVRKYGGMIRVRSKKDKGTVFCLTFPANQQIAATESPRLTGLDVEQLQRFRPPQVNASTRSRLIS